MPDITSDLFSTLQNAELVGKRECIIKPFSKLSENILRVLQREGYIGEFEYIDDGRGGKFRVQLLGRITRSKSIRPRFPVKVSEIIDWAKKCLPARDVGIIIISTSKGVMTHRECLEKRIGGVLLGYVY